MIDPQLLSVYTPAGSHQQGFRAKLYVALTCILLSLLCYSGVVNGGFFFDDEFFIQKNDLVHKADFAKIYTSSVTEGAHIEGNFYRPNQQAIYALLYKVFADTASWPYHLVSITLHGINGFILISCLLLLTGGQRFISFFTGLQFIIHPIQTQAIAYISGMADPLMAFFLLLSLLFFTRIVMSEQLKLWWLIPWGLAHVLIFFSKENAVVLSPILLVSYFVLLQQGKAARKGLPVALIGISALLTASFLYLKFTKLNFGESVGLTEESNLYTQELSVRITTFMHVFVEYVNMYVWPQHLNYEKPYVAYTDIFSQRSFLFMLYVGALLYSIWKVKTYPLLFLGLTFFMAAMSPFIGIIPLNAMFLEHWLYVPMMGWSLLLAVGINKLITRKGVQVLVVFVCLIFVGRTHVRASQWGDPEAFYLNELKYEKSARVYTNLAMYYSEQGKNQKAIKYYQKSIARYDAFPQPHHNLGNIYWEAGHEATALQEWYKALKIDPNFIYTYAKLHGILLNQNNEKAKLLEQVLQHLQNGNTLTPEQVDALFSEITGPA